MDRLDTEDRVGSDNSRALIQHSASLELDASWGGRVPHAMLSDRR